MTLWEQRLLIFVITGLVTLCGAVFSYLSPDRFKAEIKLYQSYDIGLPVLPKGLTSFRGDSASIESYAFDLPQRYLSSAKTAEAVLKDPRIEAIVKSSYPLSSSTSKRNTLLKSVKVLPSNDKKNRPYLLVSLLWDDADDGIQLLASWVKVAKELVVGELIKIHHSVISRELLALEKLIDIEESLAQARIEYEISRLKEARPLRMIWI